MMRGYKKHPIGKLRICSFSPAALAAWRGGQGLLAFAYPIDWNQQMLWAAQEGTRTVGGWIHDQARPLQPPHEFPQSDLGLHTCQRRAKANVDATAKPQVLIIAPLGIKAIRVREPCRGTVACGQGPRDHHSLGKPRPRQGNLAQVGPTRHDL